MAEAFANIHGKGRLEVYSAGSRASGKVNEKAIISMREVAYDLASHKSKLLSELPDIDFDYAITMGCGDECPEIKAKMRQEWLIPDPKNMHEPAFNEVRDSIERQVLALLNALDMQHLRHK